MLNERLGVPHVHVELSPREVLDERASSRVHRLEAVRSSIARAVAAPVDAKMKPRLPRARRRARGETPRVTRRALGNQKLRLARARLLGRESARPRRRRREIEKVEGEVRLLYRRGADDVARAVRQKLNDDAAHRRPDSSRSISISGRQPSRPARPAAAPARSARRTSGGSVASAPAACNLARVAREKPPKPEGGVARTVSDSAVRARRNTRGGRRVTPRDRPRATSPPRPNERPPRAPRGAVGRDRSTPARAPEANAPREGASPPCGSSAPPS